MAHTKKHGGPVPPGNKPQVGPEASPGRSAPEAAEGPTGGEPFHEQDPKRRLGDFEGKGEHSLQQPGGLNDANH
jgi:hypothetical protein